MPDISYRLALHHNIASHHPTSHPIAWHGFYSHGMIIVSSHSIHELACVCGIAWHDFYSHAISIVSQRIVKHNAAVRLRKKSNASVRLV